MNCHKIFRLPILLLFCILACNNVAAQRYVADHLFNDSIPLREVTISKGDTVTLDVKRFIPNGELLEYRGESDDIYRVVMEYDGKLYAVHREDVKLSEDNEPDVVNIVQEEALAWRHTEIGHFFHTMKPYYLIVVIMIFTWLMSWIMKCSQLPRFLFGLFVFLVPIGLIAVALLEGAAFAWCKNFLWWINQDTLGFWKTLLMMFPVIATLLMQIKVGMSYKAAIEDWCGEDLRWRPAFIGVAVSLPLGFLAAIICAIGEHGSAAENMGMAIGFFTPLTIAFLICMAKNCRSLGLIMGLAFTLFSFVYAVGCIIAVGLAIVVVFRLTITALMWLLPGAMLFLGSASSGGGSKKSYEFNGKKYSSESEYNSARNRYNIEQFKQWKDYHSK